MEKEGDNRKVRRARERKEDSSRKEPVNEEPANVNARGRERRRRVEDADDDPDPKSGGGWMNSNAGSTVMEELDRFAVLFTEFMYYLTLSFTFYCSQNDKHFQDNDEGKTFLCFESCYFNCYSYA